MFSIFNKKPVEGTVPAVAPISATEPKKNSMLSSIKSLFSSAPVENRNHLHQSRIVKVLSETQRKSDYLANQIAIDYKGAEIETLVPFYRDLFYLPVDKAVVSDSFNTLMKGLKDNTITKLVGKATSFFAKAGKVHAEEQVKLTLLDGMQKGLMKALQGKLSMDSEKEKFFDSAMNSLEQGLETGSVDPKQAIEEAGKMGSDALLVGTAQDPESVKRLAKLQEDAAQKIVEAEKTAAIDTVTGVYVQQNDRLGELKALFDKLQSLANKPDSTVEASLQVNQEILEVTDQILSLMKEMNIETGVTTSGQIMNPLSKNITETERKELNARVQYEIDRITLLVKEQTEATNAELIEKLVQMQGTKSLRTQAYDAVFGKTSDIDKTLQLSAKNQYEIALLKKSIAAFEKTLPVVQVEETEAPAVEVVPQKSFTEKLRGFMPNFLGSKPAPTPEEKLVGALADLEKFEAQEDVAPVLTEQRELDAKLQEIQNKKYSFLTKPFYAKAQKKAEQQTTDAIVELQTRNAEIFTKHAELTQAVIEAESAMPVIEETVEEIDPAYFTNTAV